MVVYYTNDHKSSGTISYFGKVLRATRKDAGHRRTQWVELTCENPTCRKQFERRLSETKKRSFCSRPCFQTSTLPSESGTQGGGRPRQIPLTSGLHPEAPTEISQATTKYGTPEGWFESKGYVTYQWPAHPDSQSNRISEHRAVAYEHLGDLLNGHHIRHINGDASDNTWNNLMVQNPKNPLPKPEGVRLWQDFYTWAQQHSPEMIDQYKEIAAK